MYHDLYYLPAPASYRNRLQFRRTKNSVLNTVICVRTCAVRFYIKKYNNYVNNNTDKIPMRATYLGHVNCFDFSMIHIQNIRPETGWGRGYVVFLSPTAEILG